MSKKKHKNQNYTAVGKGLPILGDGTHTVISEYQGLGEPPATLHLRGNKFTLRKVQASLHQKKG